jgi:dynein heavy chain
MQIKKEHLRQLTMELEALKKFQIITAQQENLQKEAQKTEFRLKRANDLINDLAGEKSRWEDQIKVFDQLCSWLPGDCFVAVAFLCYCGPFPSDY